MSNINSDTRASDARGDGKPNGCLPVQRYRRAWRPTQEARLDALFCTLLVGIASVIGLANVSNSGPQWLGDAAAYTNNGAMVRDWIKSGEWLHPIQFAEANYQQYSVNSIPYHPPGYALLLGSWFYFWGMSYQSARVFVALWMAGGISALVVGGWLWHNLLADLETFRSAVLG